MSYRKVDDRIITEEQYQSEKTAEGIADMAWKCRTVSIPAAIIAGAATFFGLHVSGWFWCLMVSLIVGGLVYLLLIPGLILMVLFGIGYGIYSVGGFG